MKRIDCELPSNGAAVADRAAVTIDVRHQTKPVEAVRAIVEDTRRRHA